MSSRIRLALVGGLISLAGCGSLVEQPGPLFYSESPSLTGDAKDGGPSLKDKPNLQKVVRDTMKEMFGSEPRQIKVPEGTGLPLGGLRLANYRHSGEGAAPKRLKVSETKLQDGGYSLYRTHCLHCHGVSGDGNGPTAPYLFPRPRDFRNGLFKFTSTPNGAKPTREDLRKTLRYGLHGTSMPSFETLMSRDQIEQVLDYLIYLSQRGETELALISELDASGVEDTQAAGKTFEELTSSPPSEVAQRVFDRWKNAETQVVIPKTPRVVSTPDSIARGKALYLDSKVGCTSCHGDQGQGNGPSFIDRKIFEKVVFGRMPLDNAITARHAELADLFEATQHHSSASSADEHVAHGPTAADPGPLADYLKKNQDLWKQSLNIWGEPMRPAGLSLGVYKGGRRPIDLYWRIANGVTGAKMPSHIPSLLSEAQAWDVINFVLALPYQPDLLLNIPPTAKPASPPTMAQTGVTRSATP